MSRRQTYRRGVVAYSRGQYERTVEILTPLSREGAGAIGALSRYYLSQAHHRLGARLFERRRFADAARHFEAAARLNPAGGGVARFLASCYAGTGRLDRATETLEALLRDHPEDGDARISLSLALWKQGRPGEARATLEEGVRRRPLDAEIHYHLGVMLAAADEFDQARTLLEKAVVLDPMHALGWERLAQCCSVEGRAEEAVAHLERAHQADPSHARIAWQLSLVAADSVVRGAGRSPALVSSGAVPAEEAAIVRLSEAITAEPDFVEAFLSLPSTEVDRDIFSVLASAIEQALEHHPEFADLHYHCGEVCRRLGRQAEAIAHVEKAVSLNPRYVSALIRLARLYGETDRWREGMKRLEQAIDAGGDYPDVHFMMGRLAQRDGQADRARQAYRRALDLNDGYEAARDALHALAG